MLDFYDALLVSFWFMPSALVPLLCVSAFALSNTIETFGKKSTIMWQIVETCIKHSLIVGNVWPMAILAPFGETWGGRPEAQRTSKQLHG